MNIKSPWIPLLAALAASGALILGACGGEAPEAGPEPEPVAVETAVAEAVEVPEVSTASGAVEAWRRAAPGTKILGRIESVPAREGEKVVRGQVLARLESRDLAAAVEQAEAGVAMAEAQLTNARAQYERMTDLHSRGSVTDKNLEDATAGFRLAEAGLRQARANLAATRVTFAYAEVESPLAGWVVERRAEAGDMATPGQPLFVVEDLSKVKVVVQVPEADVVGLEEGAPAEVAVDVLESTFTARVDRVVPAGDPMSRTFAVQLVLENPRGRMKSGMFARARFPRETSRRALLVPPEALARRGQLDGLYVVEDGRARLRWVKLGASTEAGVEVISGLEPGETYIPRPPPRLTDGAPVTASSAPSPDAGGR